MNRSDMSKKPYRATSSVRGATSIPSLMRVIEEVASLLVQAFIPCRRRSLMEIG
jgi:hypothetical protein